MERGTTLPELVLVLFFLSVGVGISLSFARDVADVTAVRGAREAVLAHAHRTRLEARRSGGATLRVSETGIVQLEGSGGELIAELDLTETGVEVEVGGTRSSAELRFGPRGTASFAATTLTLRRGEAEGRIVISAQGRVRR